jgi:hypothetical protein
MEEVEEGEMLKEEVEGGMSRSSEEVEEVEG